MDREISTESRVTVEEERGNGGGISRRTFLKGVGGVAAAAAVLGISGLKSKALAQPIPTFVDLPKKKLLLTYLRMQRIRRGELKVREVVLAKKYAGLRSAGHSSAGEEACCVGVAMAMEKDDWLTGTHRSHGYPLAMGLDPKPWMAELFTKVTGSNKGHGGSMHIAEASLGILGMSGIVGSGVPHAVGAAKAFKLKGTRQVAVSTCGDGAMNSSGFNSSLNLAAIWELPVIFVVHNNQWAIDVPSQWENALAKAGKDLSVRASGWDVPGVTVDGNDFFAVYRGAKYCLDRARNGKGPSMLEVKTFRMFSHSGTGVHEVTKWPHNQPEVLEYWLRKNPITRFERNVLEGGLLTQAELTSIQKQVDAEILEALDFADKSPYEEPEAAFKYVRDVLGA